MGARKGRISLACSPARSRGDNPLFPGSARVRLSNGFVTPRFCDLCRTHGQTEAYRHARTYFHHPLCAAAHDRLSIRCWNWKTPGAGVCARPQRSSASMSFSWLFLGRVVSTRARFRFTNREQCAVRSIRRSRILQRTANYLLTFVPPQGASSVPSYEDTVHYVQERLDGGFEETGHCRFVYHDGAEPTFDLKSLSPHLSCEGKHEASIHWDKRRGEDNR
jgi:hypothetical protein